MHVWASCVTILWNCNSSDLTIGPEQDYGVKKSKLLCHQPPIMLAEAPPNRDFTRRGIFGQKPKRQELPSTSFQDLMEFCHTGSVAKLKPIATGYIRNFNCWRLRGEWMGREESGIVSGPVIPEETMTTARIMSSDKEKNTNAPAKIVLCVCFNVNIC